MGFVVCELHRLADLGHDEGMLTLLPQGLLSAFALSGLQPSQSAPDFRLKRGASSR
ncbi:hypothetical protein [Pararhodobacter sp. SW119]|uniref:hypothetical protein n=1 Tax=Pararhodobacter sp. SW119 TaxID=2780075 RepID=UPI001AE014AD|nr:hypothetical protein [Pararhodobacter sp. SW119]